MKNLIMNSSQMLSVSRKSSFMSILIILTLVATILSPGCTEGKDDGVKPEVKYQFSQLVAKFQQAGINLTIDDVKIIDNAGTSNSEKISYLIANSYLLDVDTSDTFVSSRLANLPDSVKISLNSIIMGIVGSIPTAVYEVLWNFDGQILTSIALVNSSTQEIVYASISSNLTLKSKEIDGPDVRFIGFKEIAQPTNPGNLYNRWGENIFGIDLYTVAISWGNAFCNQEGCITIPNDPNLWIQVEIESSLGWTADAVVTGYQVSPDCKSVTFQITIVAAGPLATLDITTNADGIKVGANVKGPVGTFKKTLNKTWKCP